MLLIKSPIRAPQLVSCPALLTKVCGDPAVPSSSYCGVCVVHNCVFLQHILHGYFFFGSAFS